MEGFSGHKVKMDDYEIMQTLGTGFFIQINFLIILIGSFGRVRLARNKTT